jgi:ATP-binding cassette subfamily F protein 3
VCDEFWMVSRGGVEPFDGDLDDYQRYLLDEGKRLRAEAVAQANAAALKPVAAAPVVEVVRKEDAQLRKEINEKKRPLKKELDGVEKTMATLESEKTELHDKLSKSLPPAEIAQTGKRLKVVEDDLANLELRWLELTEALETA